MRILRKEAHIIYLKRHIPGRAMQVFSVILALFFCLSGLAAAEPSALTEFSIEELMNIKVTSVSKKAQHLSESAAAIYVITDDDLRRSGVTHIVDALRMVPGMNVARIDSNKWAVNARGSNSRFSDKLLVLVDGRSVYTPFFSGVYWEVQNIMLEDVERIEVIRGPGAALWGANAVNGVINIITKSAADTQGGFVSAGGGSYEKAFANARFGDQVGDNTYYRIYATGNQRGAFKFLDGADAHDDWDIFQGGFRLDSGLTASDYLTVQGDLYEGDIHQRLNLPMTEAPYQSTLDDDAEVSGGNLLARWQRTFSSTADLALQLYYDANRRKEAWSDQDRDTFDIDLQHHFRASERNDMVWGLRYYRTQDAFNNTPILSLDPTTRTDELFSAFLQDEITLIRERVWLTLGSKIEHNDYTGYEFQPSARLFWSAAEDHKFWGSVSRAVRTPSRIETDGQLYNGVHLPTTHFMPPVIVGIVGNDDSDSERLVAYELGYRFLPNPRFSFDLSIFYNDYDGLRMVERGAPVFMDNAAYVFQPLRFVNGFSTQTYGAEVAVAWHATDWMRVNLSYSYLESDFEDSVQLGKAPKNQVSLRTAFTLREDLDLDFWLRYVDDATTAYIDSASGFYTLDAYLTLDLRLAWRPIDSLELAIVGQNLLDNSHLEFVQEAYSPPSEVPSSIYGMVTYRF
ncbi:TonB-dependent receptor [Desulfosarcina cetonica]|nr:TonB-dependent receptor [Desulfosarcina cetonica]